MLKGKKGLSLLLLLIYGLIFLLGFRSGEVYNRMKKGMKVEGVTARPAEPKTYIVVDKRDFGTYKSTDIVEYPEGNIYIKLLFNDKLRHLLKNRNIEIYTPEGQRLY